MESERAYRPGGGVTFGPPTAFPALAPIHAHPVPARAHLTRRHYDLYPIRHRRPGRDVEHGKVLARAVACDVVVGHRGEGEPETRAVIVADADDFIRHARLQGDGERFGLLDVQRPGSGLLGRARAPGLQRRGGALQLLANLPLPAIALGAERCDREEGEHGDHDERPEARHRTCRRRAVTAVPATATAPS